MVKTLRVKEDTWKEANSLKYKLKMRTMDELIKFLIKGGKKKDGEQVAGRNMVCRETSKLERKEKRNMA